MPLLLEAPRALYLRAFKRICLKMLKSIYANKRVGEQRMKMKLIKRMVYASLSIALIFMLYVTISIYQYGNKDERVQVDAVIVLGAAVWEGQPSLVFQERINHGLWLYNNSYAKKIIFTGGAGEEGELAEAIVARYYALENSIPDEDILIETESRITQENLYFTRLIAEENSLNSFIIVSDPLHMKRAMLMAQDYNLKAYSSPTPTTKYKSWRSKSGFLAREVYYYIGYSIYRLLPY